MAFSLHSVTYGYGSQICVQNLTLSLETKDFCAVVGGNGSGKSTLLKGLAGLLKPLAGEIKTNSHFHYLPQNPQLNLNYPLTLREFLLLDAQAPERLKSALTLMRLVDFVAKPLATLSGGQLQRAIFARLILSKAEVLLLDEPFSMMDSQTTLICLDYLKQQAKNGRVVMCVLHDYELVRHYFPKTLILSREMLGFGKTSEVLTPDLMHKAHKT